MTSLALEMHRSYENRQPLPIVPLHVQMHRSYQDTGEQSLATLMHRSWEDRTLYADASTVKVDDLLLRLRRMGPAQGSQYAKQLLELLDRDPGLRRQMAAKDLAMLEAWRKRWDYAEFVEAEHPRNADGEFAKRGEYAHEWLSQAMKFAPKTRTPVAKHVFQTKRVPVSRFEGRESVNVDMPLIASSGENRNRLTGTILGHAWEGYKSSEEFDPEAHKPDSWRDGVHIDRKFADWLGIPHQVGVKDHPVGPLLKKSERSDYAEFNESEHPRQPAGSPEGGEFASQMHEGFTGRHDNAKAMAESAKATPKKELLLQGGGLHKHGSEWANKFTVLLAQANRGTRKDRSHTDELRMNVVSAYNKAMGNRINEVKQQVADNFGPEALDSPAWKTFLRSTGNKGTPFEHEFEAAAKAAADDAAKHGSSDKAYENRFDLFDKLKEHKSKMTRLSAQHADAIDAAHRQLVKDLRGMSGGVKYAEEGDVIAAGPDMQAVAYGLAELLKLFRQPAPIVNVAPPVVNVQVAAPQVTVQPPAVTVEAPNVTFEPSPAPIINLQPNVTVEAPKEGPMRTELIFNDDGKIMGKRTIPE